MKPKRALVVFAGLVTLLTASPACNTSPAAPTIDIAAAVAQTQTSVALEQLLTATADALQASPANTPAPQPTSQPPSTGADPTVTPSVSSPPDCTNKAKFEAETIPDTTILPPRESFVKTWTLRNMGTCTWTPDYALVFIKDEQMGGTSPSPIGETVPPDSTIQLFLPQTAPQEPGAHQGFWKLRSSNGQDFGLGDAADVAFWVKITVEAGASSGTASDLGAPTWVNSFEGQSAAFDLGSDSNTSFALEDGNLVMTAIVPSGDLWRVSSSYLDDFALEARFKTGPSCSGKDSYGLLVRAPDQPDSIIDSGYVFALSCGGEYRIYRMDNGSFSGIVNWAAHSSIKAGPAQDNDMLIQAKGDSLQLYVNGNLVYEFTDSTYPGGLFGLMIRSDTTPDLKVFVKQIAYWKTVP